MSTMLEEIAGALGGQNMAQLASLFGADNDTMSKGVAAALPALLGGLARNTRDANGAENLAKAVGADHDGSILDSLGAIFGGSKWANQQADRHGQRILGHVFGNDRPRVERQVQQTSGLSSDIVSKLLPLLAPVVLGYLGKRMSGSLGGNQVASQLQQERSTIEKQDGIVANIIDMLDGDDDNDANILGMAGDLLSGPAGRMILGKLLGS